jgi:hypothetical protein
MRSGALLEEILDAHGGRSRWRNVEKIEFSLSSGGFAFTSKFQPFSLRNLSVAVSPHARKVVLNGFDGKDPYGIWEPLHVRILNEGHTLISERWRPRQRFGRFAKRLWWDKLDILYFAGYALWNYLSFPFILDLPGVSLLERENSGELGSHLLEATFDPEIPTHSASQSFHVSASRELVRHDYTADVISSWARAANCCLASELVDGFRFYTRRRVYPTVAGGTAIRFPTLVWINLENIRVTRQLSAPAGPRAGPSVLPTS